MQVIQYSTRSCHENNRSQQVTSRSLKRVSTLGNATDNSTSNRSEVKEFIGLLATLALAVAGYWLIASLPYII